MFWRTSGHFAEQVVILCVFIALSSHAVGKITEISLSELVGKSELIVSGEVVEQPNDSNNNDMPFFVRAVLKGKKRPPMQILTLCAIQYNFELPDLSPKHSRILFLVRHGSCFELTHGIRASVFTEGNVAYTAQIEDQPETQPLDGFIQKIRGLALPHRAVAPR